MNMEQLQKENDELRAHVERLREAFIEYKRLYESRNYYSNSEVALASGYLDAVEEFHTVTLLDAIEGTPAQSLNYIMAKVEEDTIWRCEIQVRKEWRLVALNGNNYCLRQLPRKYSNQTETMAKEDE